MTDHVFASLSAYLDGELAPSERQAVDAHLALCDDCATRLLDLAAVDEMARALPVEAPAGYFEALPARIRFKVTRRRARVPRLPAWSWAAAAALLVAVVTPLLLERSPKPAEVARTVAPAPEPALSPGRLDQKEQATAKPPLQARGPAADIRQEAGAATSSYDEAQPAPKRVWAPLPAAPGIGLAQGTLARSNEAAAPRAKADGATAKDKAEEVSPPDRVPSQPAASASFVPPPEAALLEGAAGQHLFEPEAESDREVADVPANELKKAGSAPGSTTAGLRDADAVRSERRTPRLRFHALQAEAPSDAVDARRLREQWRAFVAQGPPARQADEGRVRIVEMGIQAWRLSNDPADLILAKRDAEAYLRRDDAAQGDRVRALVSALGN